VMSRVMGYTWSAPSATDPPGQGCLIAPVVAVASTWAALCDGKTLPPRPLGAARVINWSNR
jgi:hypothetical protein